MARHSQSLSVGADNTRHLSLGVLALCFPAAEVQRIITQCGRASRRVRDLPAVVTAFYVIALSLFPSVGYQSVLRWLLCGLQWLGAGSLRLSGKGSLSRARQRLGEEPMRRIFTQLARPLADAQLAGSYWKQLHVVALDGSTLALQDTRANAAAFGRPGNQHGAAAYPRARLVALAEVGTHLIFEARLGRYTDSELALAAELVAALQPGMICLADRLFPGYHFWKKAAATGAHLLWRAKTALPLEPIEALADGSWLARWPAPPRTKDASGDASEVVVRVVEYRLDSQQAEPYRLITTLRDPALASARELAAFYPQRWEIELTIQEGKNVLRQNQLTLRSKVPELVRQEFWGLLLAHHLVRKMMARAALASGEDPDRFSFAASAEIIKSTLTGPVLSFPPSPTRASAGRNAGQHCGGQGG